MAVIIQKAGWNPKSCSGSRVDILCSDGLEAVIIEGKYGGEWKLLTPKTGIPCPVVCEVDYNSQIRVRATAKKGFKITTRMPITKTIKKAGTIIFKTEVCETC